LIYKNLIRSFLLVFSLLANYILVAQGGLTFMSNDKPKDERTSYHVFEKDINFKNNLKVSFKLTLYSPLFIGEILSIKNTRNQKEISLYYKYTYNEKNESFIQINKVGEEKIYQNKISDEIIINGTWIDVQIILDFINEKIVFSFNGNTVEIPQNFERNKDNYDIVFGKHDIYFDVPSFKIMNLDVSSDDFEINFPLNQMEGEEVYSKNKKHKGYVENPYWLIGDFYHWKKTKTFLQSNSTEVVFDQLNSSFYLLANTYLLRYNFLLNTVDSIPYNNKKDFVKSIKGKGVIDYKNNSIVVYKTSMNRMVKNDLLIQKLGLTIESEKKGEIEKKYKDSYTIASLSLDTFKWESIDEKNLFEEIRFHNNTFLNNKSDKMIMFGGYSNFHYFNDFIQYDLRTKERSEIIFTGDVIPPRFFASHSFKKNNKLLLYGGVGNMSGEEHIGRKYFDDLYEVDFKKKSILRKWSGENKLLQSASSENLILSPDGKSFYNLSFAENTSNTNTQLKKIQIKDGRTVLLGDEIPFKTNKFPNKINLFQLKKNNRLILYKKEYQDNQIQKNQISFYTIEFEPVTFDGFKQGQVVIDSFFTYKLIIAISIIVLLVTFTSIFLRRKYSISKIKKIYPDYLFVRSNRQNIKISFVNIIAVEALKDYIKIICADKTHIVHSNLSKFEVSLPAELFVRVHRSFIVNINEITSIDVDLVYLDKRYYKIGGKYIEGLKSRLNITKV
jgi:hypothetical protein